MVALNFRTKLLLAMMLLVAVVTITTLLITENQVRASYERHFQQSFNWQVTTFLQQREERLAPVKQRVVDAAASPRVIAAMEIAGHKAAEPIEIDDLYQNGLDQLREILNAYSLGRTNFEPGFFFFLNNQDKVLRPSAQGSLPFARPNLKPITTQIEMISKAVRRSAAQQVGYLTLWGESGAIRICEMIFTPVIDNVANHQLGLLAVGYPLPELEFQEPGPEDSSSTNQVTSVASPLTNESHPVSTILSGIWLEDHLYSTTIPPEELPPLARRIGGELQAGHTHWHDVRVHIQGAPYELFCQNVQKEVGSAFPPAYQVCLYSLTAAETTKRELQQQILVSGTIACLGALGLGLLISRGLAQPLGDLVRGVTQIEQGNYQVTVPIRSQDEIGRLTDAFNNMARRIYAVHLAQEQRLRAQRLESIGALASGMAHDLNNALAPILMGIQLLRRQRPAQEIQQMLTVMEASTHRGADLVRQVLTFARGKDDERELLDMGKLVCEMEHILRQTLPKSISVTVLVPSDLWPVLGNATQIHQILLNLCINARDAMPDGGELTLAVDNAADTANKALPLSDTTSESYVVLLVSDTGTGIAPEVLPHIFEPFFTTKGPGKGTGLGLSTIDRIVRNHGGFVTVKSEHGLGTTFEVYFPRAEIIAAPPPLPVIVPPGPLLGQGEMILFVDDDQSVREIVAPTLTEHGYRVLSAANGAEALALLHQHEHELSLVLTDLILPIMDVTVARKALQAHRPNLPIILMSSELEAAKEWPPARVTAFLPKPFRLEQLLMAIAQVLHPKSPRC